MPSLNEIISGCKRFDRKSQKLLYEKFAPLMKSICIRYVGYSSDLQDVLQDGFIKVFMKIGSYKGSGSFEGWIKKVFVSTAINHLHKNNKKHIDIDKVPGLELNSENTEEIRELEMKIDKMDSKSVGLLQAINLANLSEEEMLTVIQRVPEPYRTVFNLFCIEEFSHDEIAEMLKIDGSTSRTRLLRARLFLKKELYELSLSKLTI